MNRLSLAAVTAMGFIANAAHGETVASLPPAQAASPSSPKTYFSAFAGTTLVSRASGGSVSGPSRDFTPMVGAGYLIDSSWALELDVGPTWVAGSGYSGLAVVPGLVFTVNSYLYLCGRLLTTLHPTLNFALVPGAGLSYTFNSGWAPFLEVDGAIARSSTGSADVSMGVSLGVAKYF